MVQYDSPDQGYQTVMTDGENIESVMKETSAKTNEENDEDSSEIEYDTKPTHGEAVTYLENVLK